MVENNPRDQREGHPGYAALPRSGEQKAWDSLHTRWLTSLHRASFLHSLLGLFEETQMSQIWVQQTCPDQQAEPFLTVWLVHSAPHLVSLSVRLCWTACSSTSLSPREVESPSDPLPRIQLLPFSVLLCALGA